MGYQIVFSSVGDGTWQGDAIALRFGNLTGPRSEQVVIIIDGGREREGEDLVNYVQSVFETRRVDAVIATHPDPDHLQGLSVVLRKLAVDRLLIHTPWKHSPEIEALMHGSRLDNVDIDPTVREGLRTVRHLLDIAARNNVRVREPFQGLAGFDRRLHILGPSRNYYRNLLPDFLRPPSRGESETRLVTLTEDSEHETLDETNTAPPEDNTSVVALFIVQNHTFLFTGDAGIQPLYNVSKYAGTNGIDLRDLSIFQVPHHGSAGHISPTILDRIQPRHAYISANPGTSSVFPSAQVTNALIRRGASVWTTNDHGIVFTDIPPPAGGGNRLSPAEMITDVVAEAGPATVAGQPHTLLSGPGAYLGGQKK